jgi:hypothetical protein
MHVTVRVGGEVHRAATRDICVLGAFLHTSVAPPKRSLIEIQRDVPGGQASITARVVRHVGRHSRLGGTPGVGLAFVKIAATAPSALRHVLTEVLALRPEQVDPARTRTSSGIITYYVEAPSVFGLVAPPPTRALAALPAPLATRAPRDDYSGHDRRLDERFAVFTEAVYYRDGLPHSAQVRDIGRTGMYLTTDHAPPPEGTRVICKTHLTGEFADQWIRASGRVVRHWAPLDHVGAGLAIQIDQLEELGQDGTLNAYIDYLARLTGRGIPEALRRA